jgi:hypothetical protein
MPAGPRAIHLRGAALDAAAWPLPLQVRAQIVVLKYGVPLATAALLAWLARRLGVVGEL